MHILPDWKEVRGCINYRIFLISQVTHWQSPHMVNNFSFDKCPFNDVLIDFN